MTDSGASLVIPVKAGDLRKGGYVMLKNFPCKITEIATSKTGKHGHAKSNITGLDIFTGKKYVDLSPTSHTMYVPVIKNSEWELCDIDEDGYCSLMNENGTIKEDLKLPDENYSINPDLGKNIREKFNNNDSLMISVLSAPASIDAKEINEAIVGFNNAK